jgi:hypothetical protein
MSMFDTEGVPVMEPGRPPPRRSLLPLWILLVLLAIAGIGGGAFAWLHRGSHAADLAAVSPVPPANVQTMPRPVVKQAPIPKTMVASNHLSTLRPSSAMPAPNARLRPTATLYKPTLSLRPVVLGKTPPGKIQSLQSSQMSQMRRTFEQNGWSVYWLDSKHEATAWKSEGKTGYEIRLIPGTHKATVLKTGGRNIILKKWTVSLPSKAILRGYHVYANSSALLSKVLTH